MSDFEFVRKGGGARSGAGSKGSGGRLRLTGSSYAHHVRIATYRDNRGELGMNR